MTGGSSSHPKSSAHNNPSSSFYSHRKSRWDPPPSSNATNNSNPPSDPKPSKPAPNTNPSPKTKSGPSPRPNNTAATPPSGLAFPFPDLDPPPPLPTYGFHMLQRHTIYLADGSARSYFALPPDYQDFPTRPPLPPHMTRFLNADELGISLTNRTQKRKYGEEELNYANSNSNATPSGMVYTLGSNNRGVVGMSSPFRRDGEEVRAGKYMRIGGGGGGGSDGVISGVGRKHVEVDENRVQKAFLNFVKVVNENEAERKRYSEDGKQGRLHCAACGRFDTV